MPTLDVGIDDIRSARQRIAGAAIHTPLVRLNVDDTAAEIYLKLENLQPIGSFKLRGASNAMAVADWSMLWSARRLGVPCRVVVPDHAPQTKLDAVARLGAEAIKVPFDEWWRVLVDHDYPGLDGHFIHPVSDEAVIAGNGTIGLEILDDLPDIDSVIIPFGGGGLSSGIATALRAQSPKTKVYAAEVSTAAPLAASLAAGRAECVEHTPSFVDGIGGSSVLEEMWPLVSTLIDDSLISSLDEIASAVRLLVERNRVVAEGAGAAAVAAALAGKAGVGRVVCIVSGGNIDTATLTTILQGHVPTP